MSDTITSAPAANFIAGQWVSSHSGAVYERRNPWRPSESIGEFPGSDGVDVAAAVAQRCVEELRSGILHVNSQTAGAEVHVPFGGTKESGFGPHEQGSAAHEFYTEQVTVYQDV